MALNSVFLYVPAFFFFKVYFSNSNFCFSICSRWALKEGHEQRPVMSAACPVGPGADSTDTQFRRSGQVQGTWKHKAVIFGGAGGHHRVFPSFWPGCRGFRDTGREAACGRHPGAPGRVTRAHLELEMGSEALGRMGSRGGG